MPASPLQLPPATTSTSFAIADMGSRASREDVITSRWWDAEARKMLMTAIISKVKVLCSLLPREDEKTAIKYLKELPDLDILFALRYRDQDFSREQHAAPPAFRIGVFAEFVVVRDRSRPGAVLGGFLVFFREGMVRKPWDE